MKKFKITHIINNLEIGGAEKVLVLVLKCLKEYPDIELEVISLEGHGPLKKEFEAAGIKVTDFHYHYLIRFWHKFDPYFRPGLFRYLKSNRPNLIHGHLMGGQEVAKLMGGLLHLPVVTTAHDTLIKPNFKERFLNRYLTKATGVSEEVVEYLERVFLIPKEKIVLIPDAVETNEFIRGKRKYNAKRPVFLFIGRLFRTKGIEFAMEGLAKLKKEVPGLEFLIYGKPVFAEDYRRWQKLAIKNKWDFVKFMGPTQDVPAALKSGDIFVLPSKSEGFGMAVLEAAAASKPLIGTRTGVMPEVIKEGENGYFVDYGDLNQIYEAAKKILGDNVEAFGDRSAKMVENKFSVEKVAEMYYNLYLQMLRGNNE